MESVRDVDELGHDEQPVAVPANAAFQHGSHVQRLADLPDVAGLSLEREGGRAGHDAQIADPGERSDQLLGQAIAEVLLLGVRTQVHEGEHRDTPGRCHPSERECVPGAIIARDGGSVRRFGTGGSRAS